MRWEAIKQAWALARENFPEVKRLYVDLPHRFRDSGECSVFDLEEMEKPLGKIAYKMTHIDGKPVIMMCINEMTKTAAATRSDTIEFKVQTAPLTKTAFLDSKAIVAQYQDSAELGEQIAYLVLGHETSPLYGKKVAAMARKSLKTWFVDNSLPLAALDATVAALDAHGVRVLASKDFNLKEAKIKRQKFEIYQKVRIIEPRSMEYQEGAQVVECQRDEEDNDWYLVIVDGSSAPKWFHESQIGENEVGSIANISSIDGKDSDEQKR